MATMLSSLLPKPKHSPYNESTRITLSRPGNKSSVSRLVSLPHQLLTETSNVSSESRIINPLSKSNHPESNALSHIKTNPDGTIDYSSTIATAKLPPGRRVQASYEDTIPLKTKYPNLKHHFPRYNLETCPDDSLSECVKDTANVINKLIAQHMGKAKETSGTQPTIVNYTPASVVQDDHTSKTVQIRNYVEDPMLPPKFKLRKNRHREPSPPPPILRGSNTDPSTKPTKEDRAKWQIPAAISNWKNNQGFTISLDKRVMAANGGQDPQEQNEMIADDLEASLKKRGKLSEALEIADKQAREDIKLRNETLRQQAIKEQQEKEQTLRQLAERTRQERQRGRDRMPGRSANKRSGEYETFGESKRHHHG